MKPILIFSLLILSFQILANNKYVSPTGDDSTGDGSLASPFATIEYASDDSRPNPISAGDTIFLLGGTYNQKDKTEYSCNNGTAAAPIVIMPYDGQVVIFDGTGLSIGETKALLTIYSDYIIVDGITARNSTGRGISYYQASGTIIRNCTVHDVKQRGIGGSGNDVIIENNTIYNAALHNENEWYISQGTDGGWAGCLGSVPFWESLSPCSNVIIRNNTVYNSWGEGIVMDAVLGGEVSGNLVYNCYGALMYINASNDIEVKQNYLYVDTDDYNRYQGESWERRAKAIGFASEKSFEGFPCENSTHNMSIHNNLAAGTNAFIFYWHDDANDHVENTYRDLFIYYNIAYEQESYVFNFNFVDAAHDAPGNVVISNNILFTGNDGNNINFENGTGIVTFSHNDWPDGIPAAGTHTNSISSNPLFVSPVAGGTETGFKLQNASPCIGAGTTIPGITIDYWGDARNTTPAMGIEAHQSPLAVDYFQQLSAVCEKNYVKLSWVTIFEENNSAFEIERSKNLKNWTKIGAVGARKHSDNLLFYTANDGNPLNDSAYYRLKQIDVDGKFSYSNIAGVYFKKAQFLFYPNPTAGEIFISGQSQNAAYQIISSAGSLVKKGIIKKNKIDLSPLNSGVYYIKISGDHTIQHGTIRLIH